jgi:translation elongation factor EF-4
VKVIDGHIRKGDKVATYHSEHCYEVQEVGVLMPARTPTEALTTGQVISHNLAQIPLTVA